MATASNNNSGDWLERPFGADVLKTKRVTGVHFERLVPNPEQPRQSEWFSEGLKIEILESNGVFEPLLVEPLPGEPDKYMIIDGHRRWTNTRKIIDEIEAEKEKLGKEAYDLRYKTFAFVNVEVTDHPLDLEERLRVWIHIHRQRKEWNLHEREETAYQLLKLLLPEKAARLLGIRVAEMTKLAETYEIAEKFRKGLEDESSAITWGREVANLAPKFRSDELIEALVDKVSKGLIVNSKDVRGLRQIVPNEAAKKRFLTEEVGVAEVLADIPGATDPVRASRKTVSTYGNGLANDLGLFTQKLTAYSWAELSSLKNDAQFKKAIASAKEAIESLESAIS